MPTPEFLAREKIDEPLIAPGWIYQLSNFEPIVA